VDLVGRVRLIERHHGLKPDWGKLTIRNFRGGTGNVGDGRTRTPLHRSKEWNVETLDLRPRAPVLYSTSLSPSSLVSPPLRGNGSQHGAVQVGPFPLEFHVGLIHPPALPHGLLPVAKLLLKLQRVFDHPAVEGGVIDCHAAFLPHLL